MNPEEEARVKIDQMFADAGWRVVDRDKYEPTMSAVAVREALLKGNLRADYFLLLNGKAVGVLEAKREETDISSDAVSEQVTTYAKKVPSFYQTWEKPLPILFKSNGRDVEFLNYRERDTSTWKNIGRILSPKEIVRLLDIDAPFAGLPDLSPKGLRACQYEAVTELEKSFRAGKKRALMVLATGSGKTVAACLAAYRFLSFTPMRRILFLVDRNNLGRQALTEFGMFRMTETGDSFTNIFTTVRLTSSTIEEKTNVVISTIQRLFSLLKGDDITDSDLDDQDEPETEVLLPDNPSLPHDFFDLIIIDECHRSIYGNWRHVLEYFSTARLVGLTATPVPDTIAFFNNNRVVNYTLEQSIADGVNVPAIPYRIKTQQTEEGGTIKKGEQTQMETRFTGEVRTVCAEEEKRYTPKELNRSVINPAQIRLILSTFRDRVYTELFVDPKRDSDFRYLPKTLIFALNEQHATNIVRIAREVFAEVCPSADMERYVQKITYSAADSDALIREFRNDRDFRIAVTCTLVATGTDVKPLEVLIFMRDVASAPLYMQMKGRGVRTIGDEQLRAVTPNAKSKDFYYLIDAVGVSEHDHVFPLSLDEREHERITLKRLLELIAHGNLPDAYLHRLAGILSRIFNKADRSQREQFAFLAHVDMQLLARSIYEALSPEHVPPLPPFVDVNDANTERRALVAPLADHADAREFLLYLADGFVQTLMPGEDTLIFAGFTEEEAESTTEAFEQFCRDHCDDIEALRILYNNLKLPITYAMLKELETRLRMADARLRPATLWNSYATLRPDGDVVRTTKEEAQALTNIIQLVRFAYGQTPRLVSACSNASMLFNLWCGQKQNDLSTEQKALIKQIVDYIAANGACTVLDLRETDQTLAARLAAAFHGREQADAALFSVFSFVVLRPSA